MLRNRSFVVFVALVLLAAGATLQAHAQAPSPTSAPAPAPAAVPLMYARVTSSTTKLDVYDQGPVLFRERVLPVLSQADGFKGVYQLGDRTTGKTLTITLWATQAAMLAFESNGAYQQALALFKDFFASPPAQQDYEIMVQTQAPAPVPASAAATPPGSETLYARVTTSTSKLDKFDDGVTLTRDSVFPAAQQLDGFKGAFAMGDRKTGKTLIITLWATQVTMLAGETNGFYQQQLAKAKDIVAGPPTQQDYEVPLQAQAPLPLIQANKALVRRYVENVTNAGHFEVLGDMLAPDYKRYLSASAAPINAAGNQQRLAGLRAVFPDLKITIDNMIAEGDWVVYRGTARATQAAAFMGIPATGKQATVTVIEVFHIQDGKITEHWGGPDTMDMVQQMGGVVSAAPAK